ncbi:MAG TPA: MoaD/ThiS family protein [Aggregatilinea sp.]|jgi:molybdopterin synthase sulfur carrier subunit|uniref:MoaD/ThiS family protein n=1 Tax=Aggregatilinea sp. TaxID=2806333 RepID=UPI002C6D887C|nr:MoaD/ThiS family protein [Aggregatilinea sp.]HML22462.1 MoaD/ThiS family protein [Aggregatilinea sp.]
MQIRFFASFRDVVGANELKWTRPTTTLRVLVNDLCAQYGIGFSRWMFDGDEVASWIIILVNGRDYRDIGGLDITLQPDDVVCFFPPVAGG